MSQLKIALLGLGTVGSGVVSIINQHQDKIKQMTGQEIVIKSALVKTPDKYKEEPAFNTIEITNDISTILSDPEIMIVVEVMGTIDAAKDYISRALTAGKHVVTANKDLMAVHGGQLEEIAKEHTVDLYYEASVAGGIPILRTIVDSFSSDMIQSVKGIVNGTTNYILTKMTEDNLSYQEALIQAQEKGFAESDPTSDVDGWDAARKMIILARLAFGMNISLEEVSVQGIRGIDVNDIVRAKDLGYKIKLLGQARLIDEKAFLEVGPVLVPETHLLASVSNENNAVLINSAALGETMFYGPGAGSLPTANSIVSDIIAVSKNIATNSCGKGFNSYHQSSILAEDAIIYANYYLSLHLENRPDRLSALEQIMAEQDIAIEKADQQLVENDISQVVIVTQPVNKAQIKDLKAQLEKEVGIELKTMYQIMDKEV